MLMTYLNHYRNKLVVIDAIELKKLSQKIDGADVNEQRQKLIQEDVITLVLSNRARTSNSFTIMYILEAKSTKTI